jgi:cell division transport system permease protein
MAGSSRSPDVIRTLQYSLEEAVRSVWRGRQSALLSTATIALALFVLGGFLVVTSNLEHLGAQWASSAEMSVYLKDEVSPDERNTIELLLTGGVVERFERVSKADALARFKQTFGELAASVDGLGQNPLPASYEVRLAPGSGSDAGVDALAGRLRQAAGVADVRYDRQWLQRLQSVIAVVQTVGFIIGLLLTLAAALTVANVVRLALHARRDEIEIMQLVGAPQAYIRGPFVVEGVLQGGCGAIVAMVALGLTFLALRAPYLVPLASALNVPSVSFMSIGAALAVVLGGMAVGCVGGAVAAWGGRLTQS